MRVDHFDARYYRRYYEDRRTSIITPEMRANEIAFVLAFCRHVGVGIERFADAGAGTGWWADEFAIQYTAPVEIACRCRNFQASRRIWWSAATFCAICAMPTLRKGSGGLQKSAEAFSISISSRETMNSTRSRATPRATSGPLPGIAHVSPNRSCAIAEWDSSFHIATDRSHPGR